MRKLTDWMVERGEFELPVPICEHSDDSIRLSFATSRRTAKRSPRRSCQGEDVRGLATNQQLQLRTNEPIEAVTSGTGFRKLIIERVKVRGHKRTARTTPPPTSGRRRLRGKPNQLPGTRATENVL